MKIALLSFVLALLQPAMAQQWIEISPADADAHIVKKTQPVYPSFAKAAGIEGTVRIKVGIYPDGRIHSVGVDGGPPALRQAATDAVLQSTYKPFLKNGNPVSASTELKIEFRLPDKHLSPPPPPPFTSRDFYGDKQQSFPAPNISANLRNWLISYLRDQSDLNGRDYASMIQDLKNGISLPDDFELSTLWGSPDKSTHVYLLRFEQQDACGATGNCPIEILKETPAGVQGSASTIGSGFHTSQRSGAIYPDIFIASHMAADQIGVVGYSEYGGEWGQVYCGTIFLKDTGESDQIQVCR